MRLVVIISDVTFTGVNIYMEG